MELINKYDKITTILKSNSHIEDFLLDFYLNVICENKLYSYTELKGLLSKYNYISKEKRTRNNLEELRSVKESLMLFNPFIIDILNKYGCLLVFIFLKYMKGSLNRLSFLMSGELYYHIEEICFNDISVKQNIINGILRKNKPNKPNKLRKRSEEDYPFRVSMIKNLVFSCNKNDRNEMYDLDSSSLVKRKPEKSWKCKLKEMKQYNSDNLKRKYYGS